MQQRKSKKILLYFFLLIILGSINNIKINNFDLYKIKKINVSGLDEDEHQDLFREFSLRLREKKIPKGTTQLIIKMISFFEEDRFFV